MATFEMGRPLWLLDEPTQHLDDTGRQLLSEALRRHLAQGGIAFVVSHESFPIALSHQVRFTKPTQGGHKDKQGAFF